MTENLTQGVRELMRYYNGEFGYSDLEKKYRDLGVTWHEVQDYKVKLREQNDQAR